ncbi:uncharacterized protein LOC116426188 [Nomia melanderi]|uniref:uncharacterized protein LOC116426188 n=1 Tax=Nomia melanderi TaxID=2448451 RepID=UPI003FCE4433
MAKNSLFIVLLSVVISVAWTDDRTLLTEEEERRWNTPPELIPEEVIKSNMKNGRSLSIPITANINLNTGNNAHSLGFQVGPGGVSYSESNSFNQPIMTQSQSVSLAAGSAGISGSVSQAVGQYYPVHNIQGNVNRPSLAINAATSSSTSTQNGHATTAAASSVGSLHTSTSSTAGNIRPIQGTIVRFPGQNNRYPMWTNVRPNHNNNGRKPSNQPKLEIDVKPHMPHQKKNNGPVVLEITSHQIQPQNRRPMVHIYKWYPRAEDVDEQF